MLNTLWSPLGIKKKKTNRLRQKEKKKKMLHGERRKRDREKKEIEKQRGREWRRRERSRDQKLQFAIKNEKMSLTSYQISSSNCPLISFPGIRRSKEDEASRTKRSQE